MKRVSLFFVIMLSVFMLLPSAKAYHLYMDNNEKNDNCIASENDTLYYGQDDYLSMYNDSLSLDDEQAIRVTCELFLTTLRASVRNPSYDSLPFIEESSVFCPKIRYRLSEYQYLSALYESLETEILSDSLTFSGFKSVVIDDQAYASIVEDYCYYSTDGFGSPSERVREYSFALCRKDGRWLITDVTTNDPWELNQDFQYEPINVVEAVAHASSPEPLISTTVSSPPISRSLYLWPYSSSIAAQYAETWYDGNNYAVFGNRVDHDCMNFASQCVWAGLGGTTNANSYPAVTASNNIGQNSSRIWCRNESSTYYSDCTLYNWSWTSCCGFSNLINTSSSQMQGPYGYVYFGSFNYASEGDVLQIDYGGSPSTTTVDHAMFITQVTGTQGSQTASTIKIAAHNDDTNCAYETLSSYSTYTSGSYYADIKIIAGYYSVSN